MKVLIAEDELSLRESVAAYLRKEGYVCEVAADYDEASYRLSLYTYDIVVLDINLVTGSGIDVLKALKASGEHGTAVVIISANNALDDKLEGLDLGADDYLTKPFHLAELNSRMRAVLRRRKFDGGHVLNFNEISVDTAARQVWVEAKEIILTRKEYDLLLFFMTNKNRVLSKEIIAEHLWGDNSDLADNFDFIYVHVNNLRKKMTGAGAKYIRTAYGSGYKFMDD
ncbi:DNA-binding response regulator, OmpR family, contains REC and winged-helix (wHTH) domain [Sinomicrobium oceani]|uniref:DNA-binding response regulator, OmpR family, contains REC and winged-helix (WHTH) domain n=1 Tax=Sinomicrobium oceani TaxID=1150368 RepID=A0A1K1QHZ5_9FLAO|nr:response regulator transcription factor [Sinomicrobium oceani]SFW59267.1 DNA-binding response regulator, OmpR family, contains REC and winged-helix (wHTH) domain [Sinomicrobium oceani]